jgi:hypothetical protein
MVVGSEPAGAGQDDEPVQRGPHGLGERAEVVVAGMRGDGRGELTEGGVQGGRLGSLLCG